MVYNVKIEGNGLSLEREVSEEVGNQIVVLILAGERQIQSAPLQNETPNNSALEDLHQINGSIMNGANPPLSVQEFLVSCAAKRNPDKILAIGYYLKNFQEKDEFITSDIVKNFQDAAEKVPQNISRDIRWAVQSSWIAKKTGMKDTYYVTNTGIQVVENKFPKSLVDKTRGKQSPAKKTRKKEGMQIEKQEH